MFWPFYVYGFLSSAMLDQFVWMVYLMGRGYGASDLGLAMLTFSVAYLASSVPSSYLSDRACRRSFLLWGPVFKAASALLFLDARSLGVVLAGTASAGIAFSVIADTDHAHLHDVMVFRGQEHQVTSNLSRFAAAQVLGNTLGGLLGGFLAGLSYRWLYLTEAAISTLTIGVALLIPTLPAAWVRHQARASLGGPATDPLSALRQIAAQGRPFTGFVWLTVASWTAYGLGRDLIQPVLGAREIEPLLISVAFAVGGLFVVAGKLVAGHLEADEHSTGFVLHMIPIAASALAAGLLGAVSCRPGSLWVLAVTATLATSRLVCSYAGHVQEVWLLSHAPVGLKATTLSLAGSATVLMHGVCFYLLGLVSVHYGVPAPLVMLCIMCLALHLLWQRWLRASGHDAPDTERKTGLPNNL